jgi:beta-lactamase class D
MNLKQKNLKINHALWTFWLVLLLSCQATEKASAPDDFPDQEKLSGLFSAHGVVGTLVLYDPQRDTTYVHNPDRAHEAFLPASTFKIPNSLILLEEKVVADEKVIIPWDSVERFSAHWNQDLNLAQAFRYSAFWVYQRLSAQLTLADYSNWLSQIAYGNATPGPEIGNFWLDGDLRINAHQQIEFLRKLEAESLPFTPQTQQLVKDIFSYQKTDAYDWKGKTGWANTPDPDIGWFVGWLERGEERYFYALNIAIQKEQDAKARQEIIRELFDYMGLLEPGNY